MPKIQSLRARAFHAQSGRCYYCNFPMWQSQPELFARSHRLELGAVNRLQCTAEHLIAACDGGRLTPENIVAACKYCNQGRHARAKPHLPLQHQQFVRSRLARGKWHPRKLFGPLLSPQLTPASAICGSASEPERGTPRVYET